MNPALRKYTRPLDRLLYFIRAREAAREQKELVGGPGPHSDDPILQTFRFCNINREDDAVTRWVKTHVRDAYDARGKRFLVPQLLAARIFNEPETLSRILPVEDVRQTLAVLQKIRGDGQKIMRGAYMMPVHGDNGKGKDVAAYYLAAVEQAQAVDWTQCHTLAGVAERLVRLMGIGDFLANQVCTDLRYTTHWVDAPDWHTFVLCGPGSRRGIDRFDAAGVPQDEKRLGIRQQRVYVERLLAIREQLLPPQVDPMVVGYFSDPNNLSNTFCEFDKFERALWSDRQISLRKYNP